MKRPLALSANWLAYSTSLTPGPIAEACAPCAREIASLGLREIELPIAHLNDHILELPASYWPTVREVFEAENVRVASVHGPVLTWDAWSLSEESERLSAYAAAAVDLGARALVVHPVLHSSLHVCAIARQALIRDTALVEAVCRDLSGTCCRLAIENVPHNSWAYLEELFQRLPPEAGFCFDTGHYWVRPERPLAELLKRFSERVACWHLSDNHGLCDEHLPPGEGTFPWSIWSEASSQIAPSIPRIIELSLPALAENPDAAAESSRKCTEAFAAASALLE